MPKIRRIDALNYHKKNRPGKIEVVPTKPHNTQYDLSLAYTPGVAQPCLEIEKNVDTGSNFGYTKSNSEVTKCNLRVTDNGGSND